MSDTTTTEVLLRHDRLIIGTGLAVICLLSWLYIIAGAGTGMSTIAMTTWQFPLPAMTSHEAGPWGLSYWVIMALMWWVMMIAMMVPSAAPMILLYARVHRHAQEKGQMDHGAIPTAAFVSGYLLAWRVHRHAQEKGQMDHGAIPTAAFVSGYLLAWLIFSLVATSALLGRHRLGTNATGAHRRHHRCHS
jgi:predicted metal-binding membrane protein